MKNLSKNEAVGLLAAIIVLGLTFVGTRFNPFMTAPETVDGTPVENVELPDVKANPAAAYDALKGAMNGQGAVTKLITQDVRIGTGTVVKAGDTVRVHYTGMLQDGTQFDSSLSRGVPYTFILGTGVVIKGWDEGIVGMKVGGERILVIPADLAYGNRQVGPIAPNSTLIFSVELMGAE